MSPPAPGTGLGNPSPRDGIPVNAAIDRTWSDARPPGGSVTINGGNAITSTRRVKLSLRADDLSPRSGVAEMRIRNGGGPWTKWRDYATKMDWELSEDDEQKLVYVQFRDRAGNKLEPVKAQP